MTLADLGMAMVTEEVRISPKRKDQCIKNQIGSFERSDARQYKSEVFSEMW
jgi:hypothetical protein